MWIVRIALDRPFTFVVAALLILILSPTVISRTPADLFPSAMLASYVLSRTLVPTMVSICCAQRSITPAPSATPSLCFKWVSSVLSSAHVMCFRQTVETTP
jgi:hypothetical protein